MKKLLILTFGLILIYHCSSQTGLKTTEDTVRYHVNTKDAIEVIDAKHYTYDGYEIHSYAFIDFNLKSRFHNYVLQQYGCDCLDENLYNDVYNKSLLKHGNSISESMDVNPIKGHWIPIYKFKGKFYLNYIECEYNIRGFTLSDSTLTEYYMADGPLPSLLLNIENQNDQYSILTDNGSYKIKSTDKKDIFIVENDFSKSYMIRESAIHNYPIIVIDCHELGTAQELKFDKVED